MPFVSNVLHDDNAGTENAADLAPSHGEGYDTRVSSIQDSPGSERQRVNMNDRQKLSAYQSSSYGAVPQPGNPSYTEAWALVEAARRLAVAIEHSACDETGANTPVREALRLNWRLWTIFQTELSLSDEGPIPPDIRANMLSLCNFVDKHTVDAISQPTPEKVSTLIEINRNIANGLLEAMATTEEAAADAQPTQALQPAEPEAANDTPPEQILSINEDI